MPSRQQRAGAPRKEGQPAPPQLEPSRPSKRPGRDPGTHQPRPHTPSRFEHARTRSGFEGSSPDVGPGTRTQRPTPAPSTDRATIIERGVATGHQFMRSYVCARAAQKMLLPRSQPVSSQHMRARRPHPLASGLTRRRSQDAVRGVEAAASHGSRVLHTWTGLNQQCVTDVKAQSSNNMRCRHTPLDRDRTVWPR